MDASRDGIALLSPQGEVLYANAAAAQIFGRTDALAVVSEQDILGDRLVRARSK